MEKVNLLNTKGEKLKDIKLNKEVFGIEPNDKVLYDAVILARASLRQGTHSTKNRSEVSGGGRKPWRQKGTGHARQGSIRAVQWVGGGRYGTPLTTIANEGRIIVLDDLKFKTPKTKEMLEVLKALKLDDKKDLIVVKELEENTILASRNLQNVMLMEPSEINALDLVACDYLVVTEEALKTIEEVC